MGAQVIMGFIHLPVVLSLLAESQVFGTME